MSFTDDDLKRLEDAVSVHKDKSLFCDRDRGIYKRLLSRLEAAEDALERILVSDPFWRTYPQLEAWRKAAGK